MIRGTIEALGRIVGSRRYARDLLVEQVGVQTKPWWLGSADADDYIALVNSYPDPKQTITPYNSERPISR